MYLGCAGINAVVAVPLREHSDGFAVLQHPDGMPDGADIGTSPVDRVSAQRADHPVEDRNAEQLLFRHEVRLLLPQAGAQENGIAPCQVVADDQIGAVPAARLVLAPLHPDAVKQAYGTGEHGVYDLIQPAAAVLPVSCAALLGGQSRRFGDLLAHRLSPFPASVSRMRLRIASTLSSKVSPELSKRMASGAATAGATARVRSSSSRLYISARTVS